MVLIYLNITFMIYTILDLFYGTQQKKDIATFGLVGNTSANNLDAPVCLKYVLVKSHYFLGKIMLIRNGKKMYSRISN